MRAVLLWVWVAAGCHGSDSKEDGFSVPSDPELTGTTGSQDPDKSNPLLRPNWYQDVAPLVADRCGACHREGGIGPFSLTTYEDALPWAEVMVESIESGRMPPFYAREDEVCDMTVGLLDDVRLSEAEKQLVADWVAAGKPMGDPNNATPAPLREIQELEDPDAELTLAQPFAISGTDDIYQCFRIPMPNTEDIWLTGLQVLPDNERTVHHVLVWNDPEDQSASRVGPDGSYRCSGFPDVFPTELIGAWSPGSQPVRTPQGTGTLVHPGASLVVNIHYHPTGASTEFDQTRFRLKWTTEQPANHATWFLVDMPFGAQVEAGPNDQGGPEFRIPAGVADHQENLALWIPPVLLPDLPVFAIAPHMHLLGTDMRVTIDHRDGPEECLIHTPGYRFDFQQGYGYDPATGDFPVIHPGDTVRVQCRYNNSMSNPFMPAHLAASGATAPHDVTWGEETGDEMCMAMVGLILPPVDWLDLFSWF